ncbi:hypothetical protein [Marinibacterium sp. SX1]|uniref:hypothetical protein n=1 Tax=Marinibacterium sp. SX1 TaxID=3388424 RepID=UPI003D180C91
MPCLHCQTPPDALTGLIPTDPLSIHVIPPQLADLARLLHLEAPADSTLRADVQMAATLPDMPPEAWMRATLQAHGPTLPRALPIGAGALVSAVLTLGLQARLFPLADPALLIAHLRQVLVSFAAGPLSAAAPLMAFGASPHFARLTDAARITLDLRSQGLCPLALSGVDGQFVLAEQLGEPRAAYGAAIDTALSLAAHPPAPFALSPAQVDLALHFAAMAGLDSAHEPLGLPPLSDPGFPTAAQAMMQALAAVPMPRMSLPPQDMLALAGVLEAIATIRQAFGPDALTPAGIGRVNAMLSWATRLHLPALPGPALLVQAQLDMLPPWDDVQAGARAAVDCSATLSASMCAAPPALPVAPALDALGALGAVMEHALGFSPFCQPGQPCKYPLKDFMAA